MLTTSWRAVLLPVIVALTVLGTACSAPTAPGAAGDGAELVLADAYEDESLHPLMGYATDGASKIFDGLIRHDAQRVVQPALATEVPEASADGRSYTVALRDGVSFHDGSSFGAEDVVATYRTLLDPESVSPLTTEYAMISKVEQVDDMTVRFDLAFPYAPFPHKLVLGIVPSEAVAGGGALEGSSFNSAPIGTGPFRLAEWRKGERMILESNESYWDGAPEVERLIVVFATDDNTRAQRMRSGEFDGTVLPPALAETFRGVDGYRLISHQSADYRTIMMPMNNPVTGDPGMRLALNYAANRPGMIDALLAGHGAPASNPIPEVLGDYAEPSAQFSHDPARAAQILDASGWVMGPDGTRARDGVPARFTLMYPASDTVRKDLAQAFTSDARALGVDIELEGLGWEAIEPRMGGDALVLGGGTPFDPDLVSYQLLHSSFAADGFNNPGSYSNPRVDAALDTGRQADQPADRVAAYQQFQRAYAADPAMVFLTFLEHTYVLRDSGWQGYRPIVDPHAHGVNWGPWWNLQDWKPTS